MGWLDHIQEIYYKNPEAENVRAQRRDELVTTGSCATLYRHLASQYFSTLRHKRHDFLNRDIEHKIYVLIFPPNSVWNISHSKNNSARYYHKCTQVLLKSTRYSCRILIKHEFSRQIFKEFSNIRLHENRASRRRVFPVWWKDTTDLIKVKLAFFNIVNAPKMIKF